MKPEITPGTWRMDSERPDYALVSIAVYAEDGEIIAEVNNTGGLEWQGFANAHLIESAPDLLEALRTAIRWLRRPDVALLFNSDAVDKHLMPAFERATADEN